MTSKETLKERLKARRQSQMGNPTLGKQSMEVSHEAEEQSVETLSPDKSQLIQEDDGEQLASEHLATTLTKKRKRMQQKLMEDPHLTEDEEEEDIGKSMSQAKQRMKEKLLEDEAGIEHDTDSTADQLAGSTMDETALTGTAASAGDDETSPSPPPTSRSAATPRTAGGLTPRKGVESLNVSLKAKYLEKFKAAKDMGKTDAYKEKKEEHRLAGRRSEMRRTRFDDVLDEDKEIEEKLGSSLRMKDSWRKSVSKEPDTGHTLPTPEEAYNFFTQTWESDDEEKGKSKAAGKPKPAETKPTTSEDAQASAECEETPAEAGTSEEQDKKKKPEDEQPLLDDDMDDYSWMPYHVAKAEYTPFQEKIEKEQQAYFVPSVVEAPLVHKVAQPAQLRHLENEGFYVGERPFVATGNLNRMENRLLKEAGRDKVMQDEETEVGEEVEQMKGPMKWFGEDGRLIALPNPVKEISSRPPIPPEDEINANVIYRAAGVIDKSTLFIGGRYQLDVDVNTIVFSHHHLFSREHVRASQLSRLHEEYVARMRKRTVEFLTGKISALKTAIKHIEDNICHLSDDTSSAGFLANQEHRLKDYREEMRLSRKQRDREMEADRVLVRTILNTWKDIKALRMSQMCTNTPVKLIIRKEPADVECDEQEWEQDINDEIEEMKEEAEEEYHRLLEEYAVQLNLWKEQKLRKKEARKRQMKRQKKSKSRGKSTEDEAEAEDTVEQQGKDEVTLNEADLPKPEKPKPVTLDDSRQRIMSKYNEIRRRPGEPKIFVELTNNASVTDIKDCPRQEQQRRNDVSKYRVFVNVLFNGKEVSKTESRQLGQDFVIRFAQIFNLEILYWPESIKLEIYESYGMTTNLLSTVYVPVPDRTVTSENGFLANIEFSSELRQSHAHEAVGSGIPFRIDKSDLNDIVLLTSGTVSSSVVWGTDEEGTVLAPPPSNLHNQFYGFPRMRDPIADIGMSGLGDMEKLTKWIEDSRLDPNDPSNADIMHLMRPVSGGDACVPAYRLPDHFRLEHVQDEFNFATDDEIEKSRRFRMITLRDQDVDFFKNQRIPLYDRDVPDELFVEYEKKLREEARLREADDTDSHHIAVAKFMQKVREQVVQRYHIATHQKTYEDMIREDAVPNIGVILPKLMVLAEPQRPLRPRRIERKKITAQNIQPGDVKILINIVRGFGVPVRENTQSARKQTLGQDTSKLKEISGEAQVQPFVEAMFQRSVVATSAAVGPNPCWNEELCIPFRSPNGNYSPSVLQSVRDSLYLNIFDEYIVDISQEVRDRSSTIHQRVERHWLGGIKIPFSTIYTNGRVDGTFRINKPAVLLGYTYEGRLAHTAGDEVAHPDNESTYLTFFVTIEPQLAAPEPLKQKFESMETEQLLVESDKWLSVVEKRFPTRNYLATVINLEGLTIFVTRYIKPLKPPDVIASGGHELVARYVSLIPSVSDNVIFPGLCDIWSSSSQFLQMLQGDEEEHAVLLTNFFLGIGKKAWLVIGSAIPEGNTAYVLTLETETSADYWLWNAQTGEHFSYRDNFCPLQSIGCLINDENVWANIQPHEKPSQMSLDLTNTAHWKPFFHKGFPNPGLPSIQPDHLSYMETNQAETTRLQEKIESELKKKISEWRSRYVTRWNRYCIQTFRRLLVQLEESHGKQNQEEHIAELQQILASYKLSGFPINMPYTEMKALSDAVYATGVHDYDSSDIEFALAVHIHPYPNSVLSVWVYVASLIRKRS